jgi:hypothetical protein
MLSVRSKLGRRKKFSSRDWVVMFWAYCVVSLYGALPPAIKAPPAVAG